MDLIKRASLGISFILIAVTLKGAYLIHNGKGFISYANHVIDFLFFLSLCIIFQKNLVQFFRAWPKKLIVALCIFMTIFNLKDGENFLPKPLPDHSLFTFMERKTHGDILFYAFLRKEARGKTVFVPLEIDNVQMQSLSKGVFNVQKYEEEPDVFIANLGLKWSIFKSISDRDFEYAWFGDNLIVGRVGSL